MNIKSYKLAEDRNIETPAMLEFAERLGKQINIWVFVALALLLFETISKSKLSGDLLFGFIVMTFVGFIVQCLFYRKKIVNFKCPKCSMMLKKHRENDKTYIICKRCRVIYKRYRPNSDPDKMLEEY